MKNLIGNVFQNLQAALIAVAVTALEAVAGAGPGVEEILGATDEPAMLITLVMMYGIARGAGYLIGLIPAGDNA